MRCSEGIFLAGYGPEDLRSRLIAEWTPWNQIFVRTSYGGMTLGGQRLYKVDPGSLDTMDPVRQAGPHGRYIVSLQSFGRTREDAFTVTGFARKDLGKYIYLGLDPESSPDERERCKTSFCNFDLLDGPTPQQPTLYWVIIETVRD